MKRILITGNGRAGKDTAAMYLSQLTKIPYAGSTSWAAKEIVAKALGIHPQEAWENRHNFREQWKKICDEYRVLNPTALIYRALESVNDDKSSGIYSGWVGIVVGVRDRKEIDAAKEWKIFDRILWIENVNVPEDPTVTFGPLDCDEILFNCRSLDDFKKTLFGWAERNGLIPSLYLSGKIPVPTPTDDQFRE